MIKAIETRYAGYKFRSRLEARWAVFFEAAEIQFEYEKEGFDIDGRWYLPDFWVPYTAFDGGGTWIEIKPTLPNDRERHLFSELVRQSGHRGYLISGEPWPGKHNIDVYQHHRSGEPTSIPLYSGAELMERRSSPDSYEILLLASLEPWTTFSFSKNYGRWPDSPLLQNAFRKARSARFEHGERP